jgi:transposase InsO family protein
LAFSFVESPTESFCNSLKNERGHGTRYGTRAEAIADLFDYIEPFYNRRRKHSTLGYASPMKFLEHWISTQYEQQLAA